MLEEYAYSHLGEAYSSLYGFSKAIEFYQKNGNIANEIGNKESEKKGYFNVGCMYASRGDYRKAIQELYQQGLTIAKEVGDKETEEKAY